MLKVTEKQVLEFADSEHLFPNHTVGAITVTIQLADGTIVTGTLLTLNIHTEELPNG